MCGLLSKPLQFCKEGGEKKSVDVVNSINISILRWFLQLCNVLQKCNTTMSLLGVGCF